MSRFDAIDLSKLPPPAVVEEISWRSIRNAMLDDFLARMRAAGVENYAALESDPAVKEIEAAAYREMLIRQRVNDASEAVMLPTASGSDLDNLGAFYGVARKLLDAGDPEATPPVPPTHEPDDEYRRRIQLAVEAFSTCGPQGAYIYHALAADPRVKDAQAYGPDDGLGLIPAQVKVVVLSREGDGSCPPGLVEVVRAYISADERRPLADVVFVQGAEIVSYQITATLRILPGADPAVVEAAAREALAGYAAERHRVGLSVDTSFIHRALAQPGVERVTLANPADDIEITPLQAAYCSAINLTVEAA
jgi:phage-related baseplate assembly protein